MTELCTLALALARGCIPDPLPTNAISFPGRSRRRKKYLYSCTTVSLCLQVRSRVRVRVRCGTRLTRGARERSSSFPLQIAHAARRRGFFVGRCGRCRAGRRMDASEMSRVLYVQYPGCMRYQSYLTGWAAQLQYSMSSLVPSHLAHRSAPC